MENVNFERKPTLENDKELREKLKQKVRLFLDEQSEMIEDDKLSKILDETFEQNEILENFFADKNSRATSYDKYKKSFKVGNEEKVSIGNIVASRRWGININLPETLENFGEGKKVRKIMTESILNDLICQKLNKEIATTLVTETKNKDSLKSNAYSKIAERSGAENKQLGVLAEQIVIGVLEGLSIDKPDLGFNIIEANAYQDVQNKIDFIIHTKDKKRGAGINRQETVFEEKSTGIQFTINKSETEHKLEQISKVKERGINIDDIIYVDIDNKILQTAVREWKNKGKPIAGPWKYIPKEIKSEVLKNLFNGLLNEEQEKSLQKFAEI